MTCRGCGGFLDPNNVFCDLGPQPLANRLLRPEQLQDPETFYPLRPLFCERCLLVQLPSLPRDLMFGEDYPFFSSQSVSWMNHCREFADMAAERFKLGATSRVLEIGSNDGAGLRRFRGLGIPALGVEPSLSVAQHAIMEGFPTLVDYWGRECATRLRQTLGHSTSSHWQADLVVANNVLAHVPDLQDFLDGVKVILAPGGTAVFEVAYLGDMIAQRAFDQIYTEHYSYYCLSSLENVLRRSMLEPVDVEQLPTHGGSLRVYARHKHEHGVLRSGRYVQLRDREAQKYWWRKSEGMRDFGRLVPDIKRNYLRFLLNEAGRGMVGYGAAAKATTMLNYLGVGTETLSCIGDTTQAKQGTYMPGNHIPIVSPKEMAAKQPNVVLLLAWNWAQEAVPKIRELCPQADIVTLRQKQPAQLELAPA